MPKCRFWDWLRPMSMTWIASIEAVCSSSSWVGQWWFLSGFELPWLVQVGWCWSTGRWCTAVRKTPPTTPVMFTRSTWWRQRTLAGALRTGEMPIKRETFKMRYHRVWRSLKSLMDRPDLASSHSVPNVVLSLQGSSPQKSSLSLPSTPHEGSQHIWFSSPCHGYIHASHW